MSADTAESDKELVLYDGVCGLCNRTVAFLIKRDRHDHLRFAALQSPLGRAIVARHGANPDELSTVYLVSHHGQADEKVRLRSKAIFYALDALGGAWRIPAILRFLPAFLLDIGYRVVAKLRYRIWGKLESCSVPTTETRAKFIES